MTDPTERQLLLEEHECRGLASTVLVAQQLLQHDDLDVDQRRRIQAALERAAIALAHTVLGAPAVERTRESSPA